MPPKSSEDKIRKALEQERLRARVLELHRAGELSMKAIADLPEINKSKATVQSIISRFGDRVGTRAKKQPGRPSRLDKRCVLWVKQPVLQTDSVFSGSKGNWLSLPTRTPIGVLQSFQKRSTSSCCRHNFQGPLGLYFKYGVSRHVLGSQTHIFRYHPNLPSTQFCGS